MSAVRARAEHLKRIARAGADDTAAGWAQWGEPVTLWRRFRDGTETRERLPRWLAELTLAAIPENEPRVERARLRLWTR